LPQVYLHQFDCGAGSTFCTIALSSEYVVVAVRFRPRPKIDPVEKLLHLDHLSPDRHGKSVGFHFSSNDCFRRRNISCVLPFTMVNSKRKETFEKLVPGDVFTPWQR
jgi:hypothetical protein